MTAPVKGPSGTPITFELFEHALKQAEGRLRAMQAQVGGGRALPLHNIFVLISDELGKVKRGGLPPPAPLPEAPKK